MILNLPKIEQKGSVGVFWRNNETPSYALSQFLHFYSRISVLNWALARGYVPKIQLC